MSGWQKRINKISVVLERNFLADAEVDVQNMNLAGGEVTISNRRLDEGWEQADNTLVYTGSPDRIRINVSIPQQIANNADAQRAAPIIVLRRNGEPIARSATGYIRDFSDHEQSSQTISYVDSAPDSNPVYDLIKEQDSAINSAVTSNPIASFSAEAVELVPYDLYGDFVVEAAETSSLTTPTLNPITEGELQMFDFAEGNNFRPFRLQFGNQIQPATAKEWEVLISNAPYETIPNLNTNGADYVMSSNNDGTFNHLFSSTVPLAAFASFEITGGIPTPPGSGDQNNVSFFIN